MAYRPRRILVKAGVKTRAGYLLCVNRSTIINTSPSQGKISVLK